MQNNELGSFLRPYTEINSKWLIDLNITGLEEYIGINLLDLGLGNGFLDMIQKHK